MKAPLALSGRGGDASSARVFAVGVGMLLVLVAGLLVLGGAM